MSRHTQGDPLATYASPSVPSWLYTATRGAHVYKLIIEQGVKVKYAHQVSTHMCGGVSVVDIVRSIPKQLRPTGEEIQKMIAEFSEKQDSIEIDVDEDANVSICCQHFIDFVENHLYPWYTKGVDLVEDPNRDSRLHELVDKLNETNCAEMFHSHGKILKEIQRQDGSALQEAKKKYIGSLQWMAHQFNECLEGREFDFSDYQEETW